LALTGFILGLGLRKRAPAGCFAFITAEHALALGGSLADRLGSVGRDCTCVKVSIVDDQGNELPAGQIGEIIARADHISPRVLEDARRNGICLQGRVALHGDLGYRDDDAYVFIVGRKKDIIISGGGENISSLEVEETIGQHPAVAEAAVIGVSDELRGEAVKAVVALKPNGEGMDEQDIIRLQG
jgi:acyl-coenzyme A synthetase/AMP-(fatty) acid ligase